MTHTSHNEPPRAPGRQRSDGRGASALTPSMALSSRKGQFTVKRDEGADKGEHRDHGPVLHSVPHGASGATHPAESGVMTYVLRYCIAAAV